MDQCIATAARVAVLGRRKHVETIKTRRDETDYTIGDLTHRQTTADFARTRRKNEHNNRETVAGLSECNDSDTGSHHSLKTTRVI